MQCTCCGTALPLTAKFCPECGTAVGIDDTPLGSTAEAIFGIGAGDASPTDQHPTPAQPPEGPPAAMAAPGGEPTNPQGLGGGAAQPDATAAYGFGAQVQPDATAAYGTPPVEPGPEPGLAATAPFGTPVQAPIAAPSAAPRPTPPLEAPTAATDSIFGSEPTAVQPQFVPTDADKPAWGQSAAAPAGAWVVPPQAPTTMELPAEAPSDRRLGPALTFSAIIAFWLLGTTAAYLFVDANTKNMSRLSNEIFHDVGPLVVGSEAISARPPAGAWSMVEWVGRYGAWAGAFLLLFAALLRFRSAARVLALVTGLFVGANAAGRAALLIKSKVWTLDRLSKVDFGRFYVVPIAVTALCALVLVILAIAARKRRV